MCNYRPRHLSFVSTGPGPVNLKSYWPKYCNQICIYKILCCDYRKRKCYVKCRFLIMVLSTIKANLLLHGVLHIIRNQISASVTTVTCQYCLFYIS